VSAEAGAGSTLASAGRPLLDMIGRLRFSPNPPDIAALRGRVVAELQQFEREAASAGVAPDQARAAHYALCATIDDVILSAPWGPATYWSRQSMVSAHHGETISGDRFFDILARALGSPAEYRDLLALMYGCLMMGFEGRLRIHPQRRDELDRLETELYQTLRREAPGELSGEWRGAAVAFHRAVLTPLRLAIAGGLAIIALAALFVTLDGLVANHAQQTVAAFAAAPPQPPATLLIKPLTLVQRLQRFLAPEIKAGLVAVSEIEGGALVRMRNQGVFASASPDVDPRYTSLVDKIGQAIARETPNVEALVIGYTDNQPIATPRFPSNVELSKARAQSVADLLAQRFDPVLVRAEGRGAEDPVDSNETEKGRDANRRTDIQVLKRDKTAKP
jgi:type VI secretion system protein ImpK